MGPYIAVLRDSFHAALSSRVLWVALVAIWLLLAILAPIGVREDFTTNFRGSDFQNGTRLKALLARGLVDPASQQKPIGRIAAQMPDDLRRQLIRVGQGDEVRIRTSVLADALNECLDDEAWYDAETWKSSHRLRELRELDSMPDPEMSDSLRRRRARLRIESVLPGVFQSRSSRSIIITYAGMDFPTPVAVDKAQFEIVINQFVMPFIIDWALGFALILLGILVTASIIPDMLQPGSLHLLLSKPISRPLLLLSKFVGGCAFVFLCVVQLIIGLYLIAGLRLDLWNARLLLCIPVAVFSFSVFYSISLVAGLRWRSPILSIGVTTICGTFFLLVGFFGGFSDTFVKGPDKLRGVVAAGDSLFAATNGGGLVRFDQPANRWVEVIEGDAFGGDRTLTPIRLADESIATALVKGGRFNPFGSGSLDLLVLSQGNQWTPEPSLRLPTATSVLFSVDDETVMAMNTSDLAVTQTTVVLDAAGETPQDDDQDGDLGQDRSDEAKKSETKTPEWLGKLSNMMGGATKGFEEVLPSDVSLSSPRGIVVEPGGKWLVAWSRGRLIRLNRNSDQPTWSRSMSASLPGEASQRGVIGLSGDVVLLSRGEDSVRLYDAETLASLAELDLDRAESATAVTGLGDRRFALVTGDGKLLILQPSKDDRSEYEIARTLPIRDVHHVTVDPISDSLVIAHRIDQIDLLDRTSLEVKRQIRPSLTRWRLVDLYFMSPLRMIVPQTGELGETIASLISGKSGVAIPGGPNEGEVVRYDIFRPVVSCSTFIVVMLTIGCVYFSTRDF
jgi:hypothetical protein